MLFFDVRRSRIGAQNRETISYVRGWHRKRRPAQSASESQIPVACRLAVAAGFGFSSAILPCVRSPEKIKTLLLLLFSSAGRPVFFFSSFLHRIYFINHVRRRVV